MHPADIPPQTSNEQIEDDELPDLSRLRSRLVWTLSVLLVVVILVFIPPLISVSRFQRRIASNLSAALGRPVHLDRVTLTMLPLPGFTLENFVVDDDPAFGYEPILRANEVRATVRLSSLWTRHVEFSRISLAEPTSLNLVRLPDGRWNFESVLLQTSRIEAAPTAQTFSGPAPRFPYVEATGARINLKLGDQKTPFALTDSEFALWLPAPGQWRFRLDAHPTRTDVQEADAGLLRFEGTLGNPAVRATTLGEVPIDLRTAWENAPLAGLGRLAFGRDAGVRGDLSLNLHAVGSVAHAALTAVIDGSRLRRADFIPARLVQFEASCQALADNAFHSFTGIECHSPEPAVLIVTGSMPDVGRPETATAKVTLPALPTSTVVSWLQAAMPHPPSLAGSGMLAGTLLWQAAGQPGLSGTLELTGESLVSGTGAGAVPVALGDVEVRSASTVLGAKKRTSRSLRRAAEPAISGFELGPLNLSIGPRQQLTVDARFDRSGYTVHLNGAAAAGRLVAVAGAVPQIADGLENCVGTKSPDRDSATLVSDVASAQSDTSPDVMHWNLTATRIWGAPQTWTGCTSRDAD